MMTPEEIKALADLMRENGIQELVTDKVTIRMRPESHAPVQPAMPEGARALPRTEKEWLFLHQQPQVKRGAGSQ